MYSTDQTSISQFQFTLNRVRLTAYPHIYNGFIFGFNQPSAALALHIGAVDAVHFSNLQQALKHYFRRHPVKHREITSIKILAESFGEYLCAIQKASYLPIFDEIKISEIENKTHEYCLRIPVLNGSYLQPVIHLLLTIFNTHLAAENIPPLTEIELKLTNLQRTLQTYAPQGSNSLRFLKAAHDVNIPWMLVAHNAFQYGYGSQSRWLDSSITDQTSHIAVNIAKDKYMLRQLLQKAGLPVTEQTRVGNAVQAVNAAQQTGFPVVIKPSDQDGGKGVSANLASEDSVKKAFEKASQYSSNILLEKHVSGKDYRLQLFNGKLIWAIERIPAGVTGDGIHSIAELMQTSAIEMTNDVLEYLTEQGLTESSVLTLNQFVAISRIANVSSGGIPVGVFDKVHPDNKQLAETAARLLRLDFAGIDFISPDISRSWQENGGTIIEINAQPQLGFRTAPYIYQQILKSLLPNQGRIAIIVIAGKNIHDSHINEMITKLKGQACRVGVVKDNTAYLDHVKVISAENNYQAGLHLLLSNNVDALIYCITHHEDFSEEGLPFDRYDHLYLTDADFREQLDAIRTAVSDEYS